MGIDFYYMPLSPPCRAVMFLEKELNLNFNMKNVDLFGGEHLTPEYLKMNPQHTVPTIVDDGFALWESRAVMQYLCNKYAPDSELYPKEPKKRAVIDRMLNFDLGSYYTALKDAFIPKLFRGTEPTEEQLKAVNSKLELMEKFIGDNKYVAGDSYTIADMTLHASTSLLKAVEYDISVYPHLNEWYERLIIEYKYIADINAKSAEIAKEFVEMIKQKAKENK